MEDFTRELTPGNTKAAMKAVGAASSDLWKVAPDQLRTLDGFNARIKNDAYAARVRWIADSIKANGFFVTWATAWPSISPAAPRTKPTAFAFAWPATCTASPSTASGAPTLPNAAPLKWSTGTAWPPSSPNKPDSTRTFNQ